MTQLTALTSMDFTHVEPNEFADAVKKARRSDPKIDSHPVVQEAISYYQAEFFKRKGEMQPSSLIRFQNAWNQFVSWCVANGHFSLPATHKVVESYLLSKKEELHRNTLKVHLWAIGKMHVISGLPNPCEHSYVKSQMSQIINDKVRNRRERIRQAPPFREEDLIALTELWAESKSKYNLRDLMVLSMCYETMLRKMNMEMMLVGDIEFLSNGTSVITIPFTKTNHSGEDEKRLLSKPITDLVKRYLELPEVNSSPKAHLLQRFKLSGKKYNDDDQWENAEEPVSPKFIVRIFSRGQKALDKSDLPSYSGHSARVGATQDLLEDGYSSLQVMQAAGWSREDMVIRYGRNIDVTKGAMALKRSGKKS